MVVMMDREISCKGHCEKLSHFLDHMSHTVLPLLQHTDVWFYYQRDRLYRNKNSVSLEGIPEIPYSATLTITLIRAIRRTYSLPNPT